MNTVTPATSQNTAVPGNTATPSINTPHQTLVTIDGLRTSGIFPKGHEPCIRTLRDWTQRRRIPSHRVGGFVYYDPHEVEAHIRTKLLVPAR